ncbi:MAGE-like protein 2-like 4, partial [Homarus americanus]
MHQLRPLKSATHQLRPLKSATHQLRPLKSATHQLRPLKSATHQLRPLKSATHQLRPLKSATHQLRPLKSATHQLRPLKSATHQLRPLNSATHQLRPLKSATHQLRPLKSATHQLRPLKSAMHQLRPLKSATHQLRPLKSAMHQLRPLKSATHQLKPLKSATHQLRPLKSATHQLRPLKSVTHQLKPLKSATHQLRPLKSAMHQLRPLKSATHQLKPLKSVTHQLGSLKSATHQQSHTAAEASKVSQPSAETIEIRHLSAEVTEISHLSAEATQVSHLSAEATQVSQPSAEATEVRYLSAEATEVSQPSAEAIEVSQPSAETIEVNQPSTEAIEVSQPSAEATEFRHPSAEATEVNHPLAEPTDVSHSSIENTDVSHPSVENTDVSHPSVENTDVSHPSVENTNVSHPSVENTDVSHPSVENTDVSHPSVENTVVGHPSTEISEVSHLSAKTTEVSHLTHCTTSECSLPHFNIAYKALHQAVDESTEVIPPVPDVTQALTHPVVDVTVGGSICHPQHPAQDVDHSWPPLDTPEERLQQSEIRETSVVSHPPDRAVSEVDRVQAESMPGDGIEIHHPVAEVKRQNAFPAEIKLAAEASPEIKQPVAEVTTEVSHLITEGFPDDRCPIAEDSYPVAEITTEVVHTTGEATAELSHPLPEISTGVSCTSSETLPEVTQKVKANTEVIHPAIEAISEFSYPMVEASSEVSYPSVEGSYPMVEASPEVSHPVVKASSEVSHSVVEASSKGSHPVVETSSEVRHQTVEASPEIGYPTVEDSETTNQTSETSTSVSDSTGEDKTEVNHSSVSANPEVRHLPIEGTVEGIQTLGETTSDTILMLDNTMAEGSLLHAETYGEISRQLLETTLETSHPPINVIEQDSQKLPQITTEAGHQPVGATASSLNCLDGVEAISLTDLSTNVNVQPEISQSQVGLTAVDETTEKLVQPLYVEEQHLDENVHSDPSGAVGNPVSAAESDSKLWSIIESGATKYDNMENKEVPPRLKSSDSEMNDHTTQGTSHVEETHDIAGDKESNVLLQLAPVKEEVQHSFEDTVNFSQMDDISSGVSSCVDDILPVLTDVGIGGRTDVADHVSPSSIAPVGEEQVLTDTPDDKITVGDCNPQQLVVLETKCPLCNETLHESLEKHLSKYHICNTFVPAKATGEYQFHMLKRVKDVNELTEPLSTDSLEDNSYVCRSCPFASQDINAVRFHLNTHEDVYQVRPGYESCECNEKKYSYPFHKWKTLIHNSSYHCFKCNYYFACEKGFSNHLQAMHFIQNCCSICKEEVPCESMIPHFGYHKTEEKTSSAGEALDLQNPSIVTRSSGGNFGISWNIYDNCINFLDGKNFHLNTASTVCDTNLDRSYLKLPLKNVMEEAVVPDEAKIDPGKDIVKYMRGKKNIKPCFDDDNDEIIKNFSFFIQMELQKKMNKKGRKGNSSNPRAKREDNLFDVLGISSLRSKGVQKKEAVNPSSKQNSLKKLKGKSDDETKKEKEPEDPEVPQQLTRTRSGMQSGRWDQEERIGEEKPVPVEPSVVVDGEWSKAHTYICCSCGAGYLDLADIMDHKWEMHPAVWCAHTMIQGQGVVPVSFCKQYRPPTNQPHHLPLPCFSKDQTVSSTINSDTNVSETAEVKDQKTCSTCKMQFQDTSVFHAHLVECGGLTLLSTSKKKSKKGFRFKRRKGQGVPNNRYGNNSQPSTPLKAKSGDRSSGLSTPQNDRTSTTSIHSCGVKRRLELAVGSIDNLELKNRLKAIITGSRGSGSNTFRLPGRRTVRMKLRKKALETRRLRKTRHSDRVKENFSIKEEEKREYMKNVGKSEKDTKSEVEGTQNSEELQVGKKSSVKKVSLDSVKESKASGTTDDEPTVKEKSKKNVKKVATSVSVHENIAESVVSKPYGVPVSGVDIIVSDVKSSKKKTKQEEGDKQGSHTGKKSQTEKKINGVIDKIKKTKKQKENISNETQPHKKISGVKLKQPPAKKVCSKAIKNVPSTKAIENYAKQNGIKSSGPMEKEGMVKKDKAVTGKQSIGKKSIGTKIKSVLSKNIGMIEKPGDKKPPKKVSGKTRKSIDSESGREGENVDLQAPGGLLKSLVVEKKSRPKKIKDIPAPVVNPGLDTKEAEVEKKNLEAMKSTEVHQFIKTEVDLFEDETLSLPQGTKSNIQEVPEVKEMEIKEMVVSQLPKTRKQVYYSSSEDSEDSDDSEPEVIRNFRSGRRCGGRMGLRNKRIPINTRYSFRTCFSSGKKEDDNSDLDDVDDIKQKKVDYLEKEEEEFSEELPITSKRKRKVANYENQDDYTYVPFESSSETEDDVSEKEVDSIVERVPWSPRKKRKGTRSNTRESSTPLTDTLYSEDSCSEEKLEEEVELEDPGNDKETNVPFLSVPSSDTIDNEVKITKGKNNDNMMNTDSENVEGKEDSIESEVKLPKMKENMKSLNISSVNLEGKEDKTVNKVSKKKKSATLPDQLSSSTTVLEEEPGIVGKLQKKKKGVKQVQPKVYVEKAKEECQEMIAKSLVKDEIVTQMLLGVEESVQKQKCVTLQNTSSVALQTDGYLHTEKIQKKRTVKSQEGYSEALQTSVQVTSVPGLPSNSQVMALPVSKKKNMTLNTMLAPAGEESTLEVENIVGKVTKKKKPPKSHSSANAILQHPLDDLKGKMVEDSSVTLPSTAKRKKKKKIIPAVLDSFSQDTNNVKNLSLNITDDDDDEDDLPLSALALQSNNKKKAASNTRKSNKGSTRDVGLQKLKKPLLKGKTVLTAKNQDSLIKESVGHDSESSSFEGFVPLPAKKTGRSKTTVKKPRKKLDLMKSIIEMNTGSTASESELSDVPKPPKKLKKIPLTTSDKDTEKDVSMPSLIKVSKVKGIDHENCHLNHQPKEKGTTQKRIRAKQVLKPSLQQNHDSSEGKTKVAKSSKTTANSLIPNTMPVLEPMNIFKPDIGGTSDLPESDINGEGGVTLSQQVPAKIKRRRSSVEKIKDIPTRSSVLVQLQETQSPPELRLMTDEVQGEDVGISSLNTEQQLPPSKGRPKKPPQPRKRRIKSTQEILLKTKSFGMPDPPPEVIAASEVKELRVSASQKKPEKRKRAASTSGVPSKDVHELANPVKNVGQPLVNLSNPPKKNCESNKRKKSGSNNKMEINELMCIDCGLRFGSVASLEDHQQDCVTIAFEMSLMEAEDHLFECPHCHLTFALKGTQRKHTTSCRLVKYKRASNRQDSRSLKKASRNSVPLDTRLPEKVVDSSDIILIAETPPRKAVVTGRRSSKENVAGDEDVASTSPLKDGGVTSFSDHTEKIDADLSESKLKENVKNVGNIQKVVPITARGSPRTKKESQVNGRLVNGELFDFPPAKVDVNQRCSICEYEVTDQDTSKKHHLLQQFAHRCQQQAVLEVCALVTYYNLGIESVRSLVSSATMYQGSTILHLDAKQQESINASPISTNSSSSSAIKLQEILASPHCTRMSSVLETIAKHHQTTESISISGTRQEALKAVSALEEILKEMSEVDSAIRKNYMLKSMRETFEAGILN